MGADIGGGMLVGGRAHICGGEEPVAIFLLGGHVSWLLHIFIIRALIGLHFGGFPRG